VLMTISKCVPAWANSNAGCEALPAGLGAWQDFVTHFIAHYQNYNVVLGVWNEPNLGNLSDPFVYGCGLVGCDAPPQSYGRLFVATIAARNASAAPSFPLAGPETSHRALLTGYYASAMAYVNQNGGFAAQDVVTVHYYPDASIDVLSYMDQVHAAEPNNPA